MKIEDRSSLTATQPSNTLMPEQPPELDASMEEALQAFEGGFLTFACGSDTTVRAAMCEDLGGQLAAYLEQGYLAADSEPGPIVRRVPGATHRDGVDPDATNLELSDSTLVFGFLDNQGVGDCYYLYSPQQGQPMFFSVCIESGMSTGGPYDISVSAAMDWHGFIAHLPRA